MTFTGPAAAGATFGYPRSLAKAVTKSCAVALTATAGGFKGDYRSFEFIPLSLPSPVKKPFRHCIRQKAWDEAESQGNDGQNRPHFIAAFRRRDSLGETDQPQSTDGTNHAANQPNQPPLSAEKPCDAAGNADHAVVCRDRHGQGKPLSTSDQLEARDEHQEGESYEGQDPTSSVEVQPFKPFPKPVLHGLPSSLQEPQPPN
jgi:hypothetical protein